MNPFAASVAPRWLPLLALFTLASFVEAMFWGQITAFTPLYLPHLGVAPDDVKGWTGAITAIATLVGLPLLPFWGALADRYARQPVIVRSFVAHLLAGILALLAGNVWVFLLARTVQNFALGNSGLMMTTLAERTPPGRIALAFSVMNGAGPLAVFLGPLVGGPIFDHWGFQVLMAIDVALLAGVVLATSFGYRDTYRGTNRGSLRSMAWASLFIVGRSPRLRVLFLALLLLFAGWMMALTYLPLAVNSLYHGPDQGTALGWVLGAGGVTTLLCSPLMGALADRLGLWRVLLAGAALTVLLWPLPALAGDLWTFGAAWAAINGVASGVFALSFAVLSNSTPQSVRGRVMSFSYLPVNAGSVVGPFIGSLVTGLNLFIIFPTAAVLTVLGIVVLVLAHRQPMDQDAEALLAVVAA